MASPFGVRFFTRGYEKTSREMSSIEKKAKWISTGFVRMGRAGAGAGPLVARGLGVLKSGLSGAAGVMKTFLGLTLRVTAALGVMGVAIAGVGTVLITKFSKGLMTTRENFYLIETALTGVIKNAAQVRKISEWAMRYAAEFPAMYSDVMDAMKGLAMMPALKPMFTKASVADMEKIMNIVQSLAALDPQQGVKGALLAMREALAGQWRTLQYRFEIRPQAVAAAAGLTMEELKNMPDKAIQALDAFTRLNVGADTLRKSAESLGVQWGNLTDRYEMWLNTVAQYGAYRKLVEFLMKINELWDEILKSEAAKRLGQDISRVFEAMIEGVESVITGIDWEGKGIFGGLLEAARGIIKKIGDIFIDAKEFLAASLEVAIVYMKQALIFSIKNIFWPVGVEIAKTIGDAFMEAIQKHPIQAWLGAMVAGGMAAGPKGALVAGAGAAVGIAGMEVQRRQPTRIQTVQKEIAQLEKEMKYPERMNFWKAGGYEEALKKLPKLKEELVELKEIAEKVPVATPFGEKFVTESEAALEKMATKYKEFQGLMVEKVGPRKEIPEITSVEEQIKKVIQARVTLRIEELTGTKQQIEASKSLLDYEERLLEWHKKAAAWEADPRRGKREVQLKTETEKLKTGISKDIEAGQTFEQTYKKRMVLIEKEIELKELLAQKEREIGDIKRYAGVELEQKALETLGQQKELKEAILNTENRIAELRQRDGKNTGQLIQLEVQLFNLIKQRLEAEQQIDEISKKQQENADKLAKLKATGATEFGAMVDLEKESISLSQAKLTAEQQLAAAASQQLRVKQQILSVESQRVKTTQKQATIDAKPVKVDVELEPGETEAFKRRWEEGIWGGRQVGEDTDRGRIVGTYPPEPKYPIPTPPTGRGGIVISPYSRQWQTFFQKSLPAYTELFTKVKDHAKTFIDTYTREMEEIQAAISQDVRLAGLTMKHFEFFSRGDFQRFGTIPGGGGAWSTGMQQAVSGPTAGIFQYLLSTESELRAKLGEAEKTGVIEEQKSLLERLYNLNKEQFQMATTEEALSQQFSEANEIMEKLLSVESEYYEKQQKIAEIQSLNLSLIYTEGKETNRLLSLLCQQQYVPMTGLEYTGLANPSTA